MGRESRTVGTTKTKTADPISLPCVPRFPSSLSHTRLSPNVSLDGAAGRVLGRVAGRVSARRFKTNFTLHTYCIPVTFSQEMASAVCSWLANSGTGERDSTALGVLSPYTIERGTWHVALRQPFNQEIDGAGLRDGKTGSLLSLGLFLLAQDFVMRMRMRMRKRHVRHPEKLNSPWHAGRRVRGM